MEENSKQNENEEEQEEYVLLDLESVYGEVHIPPNAPYVLSGLDTENPVLVIGDNLKLIGTYEETIGTCLVFSEKEGDPVVHEEGTGPSDENLFKGTCIVDSTQTPAKEVTPVASLRTILKFRLPSENDNS